MLTPQQKASTVDFPRLSWNASTDLLERCISIEFPTSRENLGISGKKIATSVMKKIV